VPPSPPVVVAVPEPPMDEITTLINLAERKYTSVLDPAFVDQAESLRRQANAHMLDAIQLCNYHPSCRDLSVGVLDRVSRTTIPELEDVVEEVELPPMIHDASPNLPTITFGDGLEVLENTDVFEDQLRYWLLTGRDKFLRAYRNFAFLEDMFTEKYDEAGLAVAIGFAQTMQESVWQVDAISRVGARSFFQIMPQTGRIKYGLSTSELHHFDKALDAHIAYMKESIDRFDGDILKVLASYNTGQNRRALNGRGTYWEVEHLLPSETRDYVRKILAATYLFIHAREDPEQFNMTLPTFDSSMTRVALPMEMSLTELRACLDNTPWNDSWMQVIQNTNSMYWDKLDQYLPAGTEVVIPTMALGEFETECAPDSSIMQFLVASRPKEKPYTVRRGETLGSIARRTKCSYPQLFEYNKRRGAMKRASELSIGQTIFIPDFCQR